MKWIIGTILLLSIGSHAAGAVGCMDRSLHLQKMGDSKELRYVSCNCPCTHTASEKRNKCLECRHYRTFAPLRLVSNSSTLPKAKKTASFAAKKVGLPPTVEQAVRTLLKKRPLSTRADQ